MLTYLLLNAMYYYTCLKNFYAELLARVTLKPSPMFVYKVIRNVGDSEQDITDPYLNGVDVQPTPDDDSWVEYRLTWKRDKKYRVVCVSPGDPGPSHDMLVRKNSSAKKCIVMAVLVNPTENIEEHVLDRVYKFAGPQHDFFENKNLRMKHLFRNDDLEPDTVLKLLWSDGSLITYEPDASMVTV